MKIVVIGGHLSPALSVLQKLKDQNVLYLGRRHTFEGDKTESLEYRVVNSLGIRFKNITTGRLQRKFTIRTIPSLLKFPVGLIQSFIILKHFRPDVVLGFGGYVQLPVILAAFILRIPIVIHEQSLGAGLANRICSFFAKKILISWESSYEKFPKDKTVLTGIPLREEIISRSISNIKESKDPLIYITGGSSGSHSINLLVEQNLVDLLKFSYVFHQTGESGFGDFERLSKLKENLPEDLKKKYMVMKFINSKDVAEVLSSSDLVISRAGMNTVSELMFFGKPCLLIPLPFGNEQKQNSLFLKKLGIAEVLNQENLTSFEFKNAIDSMLKNITDYKKNGVNARPLIKHNAAEKIVQEANAV